MSEPLTQRLCSLQDASTRILWFVAFVHVTCLREYQARDSTPLSFLRSNKLSQIGSGICLIASLNERTIEVVIWHSVVRLETKPAPLAPDLALALVLVQPPNPTSKPP